MRFVLLLLLSVSPVWAAAFALPESQPLLNVSVPAGWKTVQDAKGLKINSPNGEAFLAINGPGLCDDLFKEATEFVGSKGVQIDRASLQQAKSTVNGLTQITLSAKGSYSGTPTVARFTVIDIKEGVGFVILQVSSPAAENKLGADLAGIMKSLSLVAGAALPTPAPSTQWLRFDQLGLSFDTPTPMERMAMPPEQEQALRQQGVQTAYFRGANRDFFISCSVTTSNSPKAPDLDRQLTNAIEVMAATKGAKIQPFTIESATVSGHPARGLRTTMVDSQGSLTVVGLITQSGPRYAIVFFATPRSSDRISADLNHIAASIRFDP